MTNTNKDKITHSFEQCEHSRTLASKCVEKVLSPISKFSSESSLINIENVAFGLASVNSGNSIQAVPMIPIHADESSK